MRLIFAVFAMLFAATVAVAQEYRLQPGDVLRIEVLEDSSLNRQTFVLPDGTINFPLAGSVRAGGRTITQLQSNLVDALGPNFAAPPTVFVSVASLNQQDAMDLISVYVLGEVGAPGVRQIERGTRVLQFLAQAGQFSRFAATKRLQLRRTNAAGGENIYVINLDAIERGAQLTSNFEMRDGDVLVVPQRRLFE